LGFPFKERFTLMTVAIVGCFHPEHYNTRSQDLEQAYQDAGQFYWGSPEAYLNEKMFFAPDSKPHILPRHRVQDIDTPGRLDARGTSLARSRQSTAHTGQ